MVGCGSTGCTGGLCDTGEYLPAADGERIVRLVAHHVGAEVHPLSPRVSAELPATGERFEGLLPPVVAAPTFAIRKPAVAVFTLDDYVAAGTMGAEQAAVLRSAVAKRRNILVAGGTSTGKTTLTNALLAEVAKTADRVVLIEDTRELQCTAPNLVALRTKDGVASLSDLVRSSLRLRPDRIPIGEVRGAEALDLLKAWGTGHPGGVGTIHAGSALGALRRLEQLIQEAVITVPRALIAETINLIAVLSGRGSDRRLAELAEVNGLEPDGDYAISSAGDLHMICSSLRRPGDGCHRFLLLRPRDVVCGSRRRLEHAVGAAAQSDPSVRGRTGRENHRRDRHHRHRSFAGLWRHLGRLPPAGPDRVWPLDRVRCLKLLPIVLLLRRRCGDLMDDPVAGFSVPVHRSLTEPILLGGAPRAVAILNGTLAAALGLGLRLWIAGLVLWAVGHAASVWAAKRDPLFVDVVRRHLRIPAHLTL